MGNPLLAAPQQAPPQQPGQPPQGAPAGPAFTATGGGATTPDMIAKAHSYADNVVEELTGLLSKPPGQLSKQDVFQGAASLLGKGLFNDPQSRMSLVTSLTQLPDDETALRKILGGQLLQTVGLKRKLDEHSQTMRGA